MNILNKKQKLSLPIAFIGGAYGNIHALMSCWDDAREIECRSFIFLGDSIGFCGHSNETIDYISDHFDIAIAGNHDKEASRGNIQCACGYENKEDEYLSTKAHQYSLLDLDQKHREILAQWPDQKILSTEIASFLLCHGSPDKINEFLFESTLNHSKALAWCLQYNVKGIFCSHSGIPWIVSLNKDKFIANCGVAGRPDNDGETSVHYILLSLVSDALKLEIRSVNYDQNKWADRLEAEGVDSCFTKTLRTGIWEYGIKSLPLKEQNVHSRCYSPVFIKLDPGKE